jgi:hypothetical protein
MAGCQLADVDVGGPTRGRHDHRSNGPVGAETGAGSVTEEASPAISVVWLGIAANIAMEDLA